VVAALCCFTPVLTILLAAVGLGAIAGYLDYVLIPALVVFAGLAVYGYLTHKKSTKARCSCSD
jgi:mercuric ion transport protein